MPYSLLETQQTMTKNSPRAVSGLDFGSLSPEMFPGFSPGLFNEKYVVYDTGGRTQTAQDPVLPLGSNI